MNIYKELFAHLKQFPQTFWIAIVAIFINQAGNMAFVFLILYVTQALGLSLMQATLAFACFSGSMLISGLIAGSFIDHIGAVRIMLISVFANGITLLFFPLVNHFHPLLMLCLLWGFWLGIYRPSAQTFIAEISPPGIHKITYSVYRLALNLGMSIGPAIGGYYASHKFASIFYLNGLANLIASGILLFGLYHLIFYNFPRKTKIYKVFSLEWLIKDKSLQIFILGMIPISMVFFQHESTLSVFLKNDLSLSLSFYGSLFTINTLIIVFFELTLNVAIINWSYRWNFIVGTFFITIGFAGMFFATAAWHIVMLTVLWTIGEMILFPSSSSYIVEIAPMEHRGSYMGIYSTCSNLGMLLGPSCGAIVMQHFGSQVLWLTCGLFGIISIVIFAFSKNPS